MHSLSSRMFIIKFTKYWYFCFCFWVFVFCGLVNFIFIFKIFFSLFFHIFIWRETFFYIFFGVIYRFLLKQMQLISKFHLFPKINSEGVWWNCVKRFRLLQQNHFLVVYFPFWVSSYKTQILKTASSTIFLLWNFIPQYTGRNIFQEA